MYAVQKFLSKPQYNEAPDIKMKEIHSEPVQYNQSKMTDKCRRSSRIICV